jgi:hypothetical protein
MDLHQLKKLTELKFQKSEYALSAIQTRENVLRAELARLRTLVIETQSQPSKDAQIRAIGADIIWLKWIGRAQMKLNIELAQVLAQKERYVAEHKRAHGKKLVSESLSISDAQAKAQVQRSRQLQNAIDHSLTGKSGQ